MYIESEITMKIASINDCTTESVSHNKAIHKKVFIGPGETSEITNIAQAHFPPSEHVSDHTHPDMIEFFYVEKGTGIIRINQKEYPLNTGYLCNGRTQRRTRTNELQLILH